MFDTYAEIFAERARSYHSAMEAFPGARSAEFRGVLEPLDDLPDGTLCDMPAGGGYLAHHLRAGLDYIGVDPASDFVALGSKATSRIIRAHPAHVPLEAGSVDYVVSLAGLHHEPDLGSVFREMRRLIRPVGRVVIADVASGTPPARFLNEFVDRTNPMGHDGHFLDAGTAPLLEAAGLRILADELVFAPWVFTDIEEAASFAGQLFGTVRAPGAEVADALSNDIGFTVEPQKAILNWSLRRIVCSRD
ncbi:MAG: class I SAM-dependent methyltransferase [Sphingomonas sp.]